MERGEFDHTLAAWIDVRALPDNITLVAHFDGTLDALMMHLQKTIEEHVLLVKDTPYMWCWTKDLTKM